MSRIVLIRGVTLDDIKKSLANPRPAGVQEKSMHLDDLPEFFYSPEEWPKTTKLQCRICNQIPLDFPKMVPTSKFADSKGNTVYGVAAPFHDWCCAALYITIYYPHSAAEFHLYLTEVEEMFSGKKKIRIPEANSQFLLRQYCGDRHGLTYEEWNRQNDEKTSRETYLHTKDRRRQG